MKKVIAIILASLFILSACDNSNPPAATNPPANTAQTQTQAPVTNPTETAAPVAENIDPIYNPNKKECIDVYSGEYSSLNYLDAGDELHIGFAGNSTDGLIEYDKYGVIRPGIAESWEVSADGTIYTFHLRKGVNWSTSDGEIYGEVKAQDFVTAAEYLLNPDNALSNADFLKSVLLNAEDFYDAVITDFNEVGVKAPDDYTLVYTLTEPTPYFMSMLVYPAFFPLNADYIAEIGEDFGTDNTTILYCGAYLFQEWEPQSKRVFVKNPNYWDAEHVYIEKVSLTYNKEAGTLSPELFLRGEADSTSVPNSILESWMADPEKSKMVRPGTASYYTYFYCFDFNQKFPDDRKAEGENWSIAVNNENFRKSIFHGLDRKALSITQDPYNPTSMLLNTVTPKAFAEVNGVDYTEIGELKKFTETDSFDAALAAQYKEKAKEELVAAGATLPVTIQMFYYPGDTEWADRCVIFKQQIENLLGTDYVNVVYSPGPDTGFLGATRRAAAYAMQECNWGPDYADPETYSDPFVAGGTYNFPEFILGDTDANGEKTYTNLLNAAKAEKLDIAKRYELFAKAEAFLIEHAYIIPYSQSNPGYVASLWHPFDVQYSPFGCSYLRWKGRRFLAKPMDTATFLAEQAKWDDDRAQAQAEAAK